MDLNLRGKRALVTGGTKGIGRAIVEQLAAEGCDVALCARDAAGVAQAVAAVEAHGVRGYGEALDVSDRGRLQSFVGAGAQALGGLDVVVCNVSALAMPNTESAWRQGLEVDILGTVNAVDAALPHLRASRAGSVVFISSTAALEIYAGLRAYNSVKAALIAYVAGLSQELASEGIRVNAVSPGSILISKVVSGLVISSGLWGGATLLRVGRSSLPRSLPASGLRARKRL